MADVSPGSKTVKKAKSTAAASTQQHLRIAEIRDNLVVLKDGGLRAVYGVSSINFNLKSEDEQNAIIYSYQSFLNTLDFPVQIVVRSKKLDLDNYLADLAVKGEKQKNPLLQTQTAEYVNYIKRLLEYANIMEKEFYVVVPYDPLRARKSTFIQRVLKRLKTKDTVGDIQKRHKEFDQLKKALAQRMNVVQSGLENCGLKVEQLSTDALIRVYYQSYNPITSRGEKVDEVKDIQLEEDPVVYSK
jgi:hypothetical protein